MIETYMESPTHIAIIFVVLALAIVGLGGWMLIINILAACADEHEEFNRESDYENRN